MRPDRGRPGLGRTAARLLSLGEKYVSAAGPDRNSMYFLLQTLVGAWPVSADRAVAYMEKAGREAKLRTSWTDPDPAYEEVLRRYVHAVLADDEFRAALESYVEALTPAARVTSLAQKLIQLTMPGVPDLYQGPRRSCSRSSTRTTGGRWTSPGSGHAARGPRRQAAGRDGGTFGCAASGRSASVRKRPMNASKRGAPQPNTSSPSRGAAGWSR